MDWTKIDEWMGVTNDLTEQIGKGALAAYSGGATSATSSGGSSTKPKSVTTSGASSSASNSTASSGSSKPSMLAVYKFIDSLFSNQKGGLYKDWSKDADGGVAEVTRWVKNDGDSPKQEAIDALQLMQERGFEKYIDTGISTRYGDTSLTWNDVFAKLNRVGLQDVAVQLKQKIGQSVTNVNEPNSVLSKLINSVSGSDSSNSAQAASNKKTQNALIIGGAIIGGIAIVALIAYLVKSKS